jgi:hypothetical protein
MVLFRLLTEGSAVEEYRLDRREGSRAEMHVIGWKKPGPAEVVARSERLDRNVAPILSFGAEHDHARWSSISRAFPQPRL